MGSVWWGNGSNSPQLVRGNGSNSVYPTVSGVTRDSGNSGTNVCCTHATGMRPGILAERESGRLRRLTPGPTHPDTVANAHATSRVGSVALLMGQHGRPHRAIVHCRVRSTT